MRVSSVCRLMAALLATFAYASLAYGNHQVLIKNCQYSGADRYRYLAYDSTDTSYDIEASADTIIYLDTGKVHCDAHGKGFCQVQSVNPYYGYHGKHHHVKKEATFFDVDDLQEGILPCPSN